MRKPLNFNHLECFLVTARTLSFSKTAELLQIAQPVVSKQIKALEESLGTQLFLRTKKAVHLTSDGQILFEKTAILFEELCLRVEEFTQKSNQIKGVLRFASLLEVGEQIFADTLSKFKEEHPLIEYQILYSNNYEIIEGIKSGTVDVGVISEEIIQENIRCYRIFKEDVILVCGKNHFSDFSDKLTDIPYAVFKENDPLLNFFISQVAPKANRSRIKTPLIVNSHKTIVKMIQTHPIAAVLPYQSVAEDLKQGNVKQLHPKILSSYLYMIQRDMDFPEEKTELLTRFLKKNVPESIRN